MDHLNRYLLGFKHGNFPVFFYLTGAFFLDINTPSESKDISISQLEKGSTYLSNHLGIPPAKFNSSRKITLAKVGKDRLPFPPFFRGFCC